MFDWPPALALLALTWLANPIKFAKRKICSFVFS